MPAEATAFVTFVVIAFVIFGLTLAWAHHSAGR